MPSTLNMVKNILEGHKLDFFFIDGDHTYEGVKADFEMYSKFVGKGEIVVFHDGSGVKLKTATSMLK